MLSAYRVLDLTVDESLICGKMLADLGADVIKIEKPGGDASRKQGPYYDRDPDPEKSLFWLAYNIGKRSITLDIENRDGRELFKKLAATTQVVLESYPPGYLDEIGLGYRELSRIAPGLILTSITPYGQSGPYASYRASDIDINAMGGLAYITGYPDGAPMRVSCPQAVLVAGSQAAAATAIALLHRGLTGQGQHVDTSAQASVAWTLTNSISLRELSGFDLRRQGSVLWGRQDGPRQTMLWPCQDGYIMFTLMAGGFFARDNRELAGWMDEEGLADDFIRNFDWESYDMAVATPETQSRLEDHIRQFFLRHTKLELYEGGFQRGIKIYPANGPKDILNDPQLKARDFWLEIDHPELDRKLTYPGTFFRTGEPTSGTARRPPRIGEHNSEIYREIGLSPEEMLALKQAGII